MTIDFMGHETLLARLQWRADKSTREATQPIDLEVEQCECPRILEEERFHVTINGQRVKGHWLSDATWYLLVGAGLGATR